MLKKRWGRGQARWGHEELQHLVKENWHLFSLLVGFTYMMYAGLFILIRTSFLLELYSEVQKLLLNISDWSQNRF